MTPRYDVGLFFGVLVGAVCWLTLQINRACVQRQCDRENARRRQQWLMDCETARRLGTKPPFPPNRVVPS